MSRLAAPLSGSRFCPVRVHPAIQNVSSKAEQVPRKTRLVLVKLLSRSPARSVSLQLMEVAGKSNVSGTVPVDTGRITLGARPTGP